VYHVADEREPIPRSFGPITERHDASLSLILPLTAAAALDHCPPITAAVQDASWESRWGALANAPLRERVAEAEAAAEKLELRTLDTALLFAHDFVHRGARTGQNERMFLPFRCAAARREDIQPTKVVLAVEA
jgi:hypothetical protein